MSLIYILSSKTNDTVLNVVKQQLGDCNPIELPKLVVGTLDSLMSIADDLAKIDPIIENLVKRIAMQHQELIEKKPDLSVKGATPEDYINYFSWEHEKYSTASPLKVTYARIHALISKIDEELRSKSSQYSNLVREIASEHRKEGTNLITKPLYDVVKEEDFIESDYLTTLLVVVPKYSYNQWLAEYNTMTEFVLPNSSRKLAEDSEFGLFTVTLFKKLVDDFKNVCREKRFVVRDYTLAMLKQDLSTDRTTKEKERDELKARLLRWCQANFGEAFGAWIHIKVMRIFVESVLRYGLPPEFKYVAIKCKKDEKKFVDTLTKIFDQSVNAPSVDAASDEEDYRNEKNEKTQKKRLFFKI